MSINISETVITIVNFLLLMLLLRTFLYKPLLKVMDARKAYINEGVAKGEQARLALEENELLMLERLRDCSDDAKQLLAESKARAMQGKSDLLREANEKAALIRSEGLKHVALEEDAAVRRIGEESGALLAVLMGLLSGSTAAASR